MSKANRDGKMIEALKDDKLIQMVGGRFKLTALIQRRWVELIQGARALVDPTGLNDIEIIVEEIAQGKIMLCIEGDDGDAGPAK